MSASTNGFERLGIRRIAFGIRFQNQFGLEDHLGAVVDDILATPDFGPDRFAETIYSQESKQLMSARGDEAIKLTRSDAIFQSTKGPFNADDLPGLAKEFVDVVWGAVCKRALRPPAIIRYGCLVSFALPEHWNPIRTILKAEAAPTSEFDLRYVRRLPTQGGLASKDVNDHINAIHHIQTRSGDTSALLDFQHVFDPTLNSEKARKDHPYTRFVERAVAYFRVTGWDFIRARLEQMSQAA